MQFLWRNQWVQLMGRDQETLPTREQIFEFSVRLNFAFKPSAPINKLDLFSGRMDQVLEIYQICHEQGRHILLYGDRGVGKTSLASILEEKFKQLTKITCGFHTASADDTFTSVMVSLLSRVKWDSPEKRLGFLERTILNGNQLDSYLPDRSNVKVGEVAELLSHVSGNCLFIIDEFDRIADKDTLNRVSDLVKQLSDRASNHTILLVGVADDVVELLGQHPSVERCLKQLRLPEMEDEEIEDILVREGAIGQSDHLLHLGLGVVKGEGQERTEETSDGCGGESG
jgi:Cdc6-like AAA superfamily ATPase